MGGNTEREGTSLYFQKPESSWGRVIASTSVEEEKIVKLRGIFGVFILKWTLFLKRG